MTLSVNHHTNTRLSHSFLFSTQKKQERQDKEYTMTGNHSSAFASVMENGDLELGSTSLEERLLTVRHRDVDSDSVEPTPTKAKVLHSRRQLVFECLYGALVLLTVACVFCKGEAGGINNSMHDAYASLIRWCFWRDVALGCIQFSGTLVWWMMTQQKMTTDSYPIMTTIMAVISAIVPLILSLNILLLTVAWRTMDSEPNLANCIMVAHGCLFAWVLAFYGLSVYLIAVIGFKLKVWPQSWSTKMFLAAALVVYPVLWLVANPSGGLASYVLHCMLPVTLIGSVWAIWTLDSRLDDKQESDE
jgi:hypothetical protein